MSTTSFIAVFVGGGIGSICRYIVSLMVLRTSTAHFPWATVTANVLSCLVMAIGFQYFSDRIPEGSWQRLFLLIGFCGGFSTFSTFSLENFQLLRNGQTTFLIANVLISVLLCLGIFWLLIRTVKA